MSEVVLEALIGTAWRQVGGGLADVEPCASISREEAGGRQVYLFGFRDGVAGVWRSVAGWDRANDLVREINTSGLELVSDLAIPFELPPATGKPPVRIRLKR